MSDNLITFLDVVKAILLSAAAPGALAYLLAVPISCYAEGSTTPCISGVTCTFPTRCENFLGLSTVNAAADAALIGGGMGLLCLVVLTTLKFMRSGS